MKEERRQQILADLEYVRNNPRPPLPDIEPQPEEIESEFKLPSIDVVNGVLADAFGKKPLGLVIRRDGEWIEVKIEELRGSDEMLTIHGMKTFSEWVESHYGKNL